MATCSPASAAPGGLSGTHHHDGRQRGLTLIEIMIVIGVLALMVGMVTIGFGAGRNAEVSRTTTQVANLVRYGYDKARVTGEYYRLLINLDENTISLQQGDDRMYLPATDRDGKLFEVDEAKAADQADRDQRAEESYNRSVQAQVYGGGSGGDGGGGDEIDPYRASRKTVPRRKPPLFESFEDENALSDLAKPIKLPEGVKITYVRTADDVEAVTQGEASLFFFPRGRTQEAHIQLEDEEVEARYTIKVQPLTGRVTIVDGHEDLVLPDDVLDDEGELGNRLERRTF
ncbi:pilus assembly FimT family protein [Paraliomyxa miuraensis]|uniref:pilus assembly FimT family protein n=1 Tax=Paraliomyxa miuraensis TaxID=376150 RepID=UPI00224C87CF|nr:prepilin-type N-terminal cleavage/methylation domain-containing protein [Paraliomyxa miuraensis]MCX4242952.1 prepilin-type N-terminal cleavage/methylation domain-containing protein [Paraliomyxa miuraensis]